MDSLSTDPGRTDSRATHDLELFDRLLGVRETLARKFRKEPYQIFKEESLIQMAMYYPQTLDDFIHIFGVGPYKQRKYGPAFTEVIQEYCQTKGILPPPIRPKQGINVSVGVPPAKAMVMGATPSPETKTETSLLPGSNTMNDTPNEIETNVLRSGVGILPFSPGGLINAYNAAVVFPQELKTVAVRGIFGMKGPKIYSGYYYDELKDEIGDQSLTLKVTPSIRDQLTPDSICTLKGYLARKINKYGSIQVTFVATGVVCQEERTVDPEVLRRQEVLEQHQQKALPDPRWDIKSHIVQGTEPKIAVIYGETGIVDQDVTSAVGTALDHYDVTTHRGKFSSPEAIITLLCQLDSEGYDYIALIRGGGSGLEVFDDLNLAATVVAMQTPVLTALGHEVDHPFLERVACRAFTTPTAFGAWLKAMVEETSEELSQSKAAALDEVKKQYNEMVKRLEQQVEDARKVEGQQAELIKDLQKQMENSTKSADDHRKDIEKSYEDRITELKQRLDETQKAKEQSSTTILDLQRQIETMGKNTADIRQDIESIYKDRLSAAEQKYTESQRVVAQQTATLNELRGQAAESGSNKMVIIAAVVGILLGLGIGAGVVTFL